MSTPYLDYAQAGGIVTLTMNRPEVRNALSEIPQMLEFVTACERIANDPSVRLVILTGAGTAFSAGGNIKHMRDKRSFASGSPADIRNAYLAGIARVPLALYELDVPTIAAVNGPAVGAGMDLACMCDVRIASEAATFAASFLKLGIVPGDGGAWLLSRVLGPSKALELMLVGDAIDANEAFRIGLVNKVVPAEDLMQATLSFGEKMSRHPPQATRLTKRLLRESQLIGLKTSLELSSAYQALAHFTEDHAEAVDAFIEKRKPTFKGR
jgi:enoyl-CoA hydratase/carnithine racemase